MGLVSRAMISTAAIAGGLLFSQAPEFAQQYRQRLGGALDELRAIVAEFDGDAARAGLDRLRALGVYDRSNEPFLQSRGQSMRGIIARQETLERQAAAFQRSVPAARPLVVLRSADPRIAENAWRDFEPAVPLTGPAILWGGAGATFASIFALVLASGTRRLLRRRPPTAPIAARPKN